MTAASFTEKLKEKYSSFWRTAASREKMVLALLEAMLGSRGYTVVPTGVGTLTTEYTPRTYTSLSDKYDFTVYYAGKAIAWIDVTGSSWLPQQSAARARREGWGRGAYLAVLGIKVDLAVHSDLGHRVFFVSVQERDGSIRCLSAREAYRGRRVRFARGENHYYVVPWRRWWKPHKLLSRIETLRRGIVRG